MLKDRTTAQGGDAMRPVMAGCSCTGVSAVPRATATPRIPSPKADLVPEKPTRSSRSRQPLITRSPASVRFNSYLDKARYPALPCGSPTYKARVLFMVKIGLLVMALGLIALVAFQLIGSSVDADGILREPFGLLPVGFALLFAGAVTTLAALVWRKIRGLPRD
jgi:Protein of unknown function (DUF3955)